MTAVSLPPLILRAAEGDLPEWAAAGKSRREHMARVAEVLGGWARTLELDSADQRRWRALGYLHDVLRDADVGELRTILKARQAGSDAGRGADRGGRGGPGDDPAWSVDWSVFARTPRAAVSGVGEGPAVVSGVGEGPATVLGGTLHGPAAAVTLAREGVDDADILSAVAYHTVGHPALAPCGRALYCADFVEPGRAGDPEMRTELRERFPDDPDGVLRDVLRSRLGYLLEGGRPMFFGTVGLWNRLTR